MSILFPGEPDRDRVAVATIADRAYYGDMTYYEVEPDGLDKTLTISMKNLMGREILEIGTPVRISWREDALVFFDR
jgi:spermidine/putrescine transport system ATP-binding protein